MSVNDKAAYACGGIVVAGLLYLIFALIIRMVGVKRVMRYLPPVVTGPVIICIGLSLVVDTHAGIFSGIQVCNSGETA